MGHRAKHVTLSAPSVMYRPVEFHRVCARGPTVRGRTGSPFRDARWNRRRAHPLRERPPPGLLGPAAGCYGRPPAARSRSISLPIPEAARPHGGNRRGEAAAATVAGGVRAVLGNDVAHRRRGGCGCEDLGDAVDLVARLPGHGRGPHQASRRSDRPASPAACLPRRPARECPTLAVPRSTIAPLASARSVLIGAADRPDPIKATKRRARNARRATVVSSVHPSCASSR